ncbi:leucyl/phenylalanyl-tRNA--protein transferase [Tamilnaduibacter salinus]|uniref:Leucyl/phenylalanyl-tRNA--protein transferase n=1 Tax=Tamilnaduibacter salinus TaxID=1484056 RepID=A0A2A2I4R8_9GAMM|nr:leucyl/phenylalanyl-tRNA--protein transferase [Tamilnaduibacter salinus]PAV26729.1 leucyl/phenylalanyl-tRNA--protein transferase [Tamilnaduibacter salinus]
MTTLPWLEPGNDWFPPPEQALNDPDGLLAIGGDLSPRRLENAYRQGIFPWFSEEQPVLWWSPNPRCVLFPNEVHISRRLRRTLNRRPWSMTADTAFDHVIRACAEERAEGTWITKDMRNAYLHLHRLGRAHSFEAWNTDGQLVAGLYGVAIGRCFFGESMFTRETDASKALFVHVANQLSQWQYAILDCQVENGHLLRMGARCIPRARFLSILRENVDQAPGHEDWSLTWRW